MKRILYLNQKLLLDPRLSDCLANYHYNWRKFSGIVKLNSGHDGGYIRAGTNVYPFSNELVEVFNFQMPTYDPSFNLSFSEVTDRRLQQLWQSRDNRRWLIQWSGGIDSTLVLASILKNLEPEDWSNIDVACNRISVYENPTFFYKHIKPNFKLVDSSSLVLNADIFKEYYVINGEPADQLYGGFASRSWPDNNTILKDWRRDPDTLIEFFSNAVDLPFAQWYYEITKENIESTDIPVENYYDFCWWLFFNSSWASILLRPLHFQTDNSAEMMNLLLTDFIPWFANKEYQQWALTNRLGVKYGTNISERKLASKKYIYDFDRDPYYFQFKLKMESTGRNSFNNLKYFCVLDDLTVLNLDQDLEQILELLPGHIILRG